MRSRILVLGAGFGGLELATILSDRLGADVRGRVEGVEFLGAVTRYRIRTSQGVVQVDAPGAPKQARGDEVALWYPANPRKVRRA